MVILHPNIAYLLAMSFMHPYTKRPISAAARQRRPTNNGWQTGLIGFDWVRLDTPTTLTGDKNTTPAAVRNDFLSFRSWRSGWNEGRSVFFQNDAELYEIIMEINDLREPALDPDRPKQNRRRFLISHRLPLTPIPNCQRASAEARQ